MNYRTYTATTAQIPLLRHMYRDCGTYTATTAYITVTVPEIPLFTQDLHHITIRTQHLEICGDSFGIVKHTKRSQKSQKTGQPLLRHIYRYYPRNTAICSTFAPFRNEWRCRGGQTSNPGRKVRGPRQAKHHDSLQDENMEAEHEDFQVLYLPFSDFSVSRLFPVVGSKQNIIYRLHEV